VTTNFYGYQILVGPDIEAQIILPLPIVLSNVELEIVSDSQRYIPMLRDPHIRKILKRSCLMPIGSKIERSD